MQIDANDSNNHDIPLWAVMVVHQGLAEIQCLKIKDQSNGDLHVWGYSEWRRSPGFRTLGIRLPAFTGRFVSCVFYDDHDSALAALKLATTPSKKLVKEMLTAKGYEKLRLAAMQAACSALGE